MEAVADARRSNSIDLDLAVLLEFLSSVSSNQKAWVAYDGLAEALKEHGLSTKTQITSDTRLPFAAYKHRFITRHADTAESLEKRVKVDVIERWYSNILPAYSTLCEDRGARPLRMIIDRGLGNQVTYGFAPNTSDSADYRSPADTITYRRNLVPGTDLSWIGRLLVPHSGYSLLGWRIHIFRLPMFAVAGLFAVDMLVTVLLLALPIPLNQKLATMAVPSLLLATVYYWLMVPMARNGRDRTYPASPFLLHFTLPDAWWDRLRRPGERISHRIDLVYWTSTCSICGFDVELDRECIRYPKQTVGCCIEAPEEHIFSFDRTSRTGRMLTRD